MKLNVAERRMNIRRGTFIDMEIPTEESIQKIKERASKYQSNLENKGSK